MEIPDALVAGHVITAGIQENLVKILHASVDQRMHLACAGKKWYKMDVVRRNCIPEVTFDVRRRILEEEAEQSLAGLHC